MGRIREFLERRLRFRSLERGDLSDVPERPLDNVDAMASAGFGDVGEGGHEGIGLPSSWVKSYDEGRPRK